MENSNITEKCWYCKKNNAEAQYAVKYDIHKLLKRKGTYIGVGVSVKTQYLTKSVNIPCCKSCGSTHSKISTISFLVSVILYSFFVCKFIFMSENDAKILNSILFIPLVFLPIFLIIYWLITKLSGVKENKEQDYPPLKTYLENGWDIGERPYLKGSDTN